MLFMAQSTDNKAPMFVAENGVVVPDGDPHRQSIIDEISTILGQGSMKSVAPNISLHMHIGKIAIKVLPLKRDEANRLAPLVAAFSVNDIAENQWTETASSEFKWFGELVGRPLDATRLNGIEKAASIAKKKTLGKRKNRRIILPACIAGVLLIILLAWMARGNG
jgi:hypothetical protein